MTEIVRTDRGVLLILAARCERCQRPLTPTNGKACSRCERAVLMGRDEALRLANGQVSVA